MSIKLRNISVPILFTLINLYFSSLLYKYMFHHNLLINNKDILENNIVFRFLIDFMGNFFFVFLLMVPIFFKKWPLKKFGITNKKTAIIIILSAVYLTLFIYNQDFTMSGWYTSFYYLIFVAFSEEFIFRGYLFNKIDHEYSFWVSVFISGAIFGIGHAILPTIMHAESISYFINQALSNVFGQGILASAFFSIVFKKSGNLMVPVLIHAILDYLGIVFS
ncbi:CPBP family intramembrane glutamic endopeptidase [Enterococcus wangshanyuanii]|uniref:CAAX prenyl protease 2/Lysostaphin resistance protein A-like domain-containing protein n=1 Tax=Enterococcus wangshanyuanii TaxID=2005703 RepID=A0ABQ1P9Z6_9ENTE|nr:CPBP family intramembrane glutamic endopeptidase [Enterococcus wangshanyuanii]GGC92333.1 hypothetical protein GCM10011573_22400 [Enterococcus wangshanyuanii]